MVLADTGTYAVVIGYELAQVVFITVNAVLLPTVKPVLNSIVFYRYPHFLTVLDLLLVQIRTMAIQEILLFAQNTGQ